MSTPIFPLTTYQVNGGIRGLTWPVMKSAELGTTVQSAPNLYETRIQNYANPRWHWTLIYNYLKDNPKDVPALYAPYTDYQTMQGFFLQQSGQDASFLFSDPDDNSVGPALLTAAWRANWTPILDAIIVVSGNAWEATTVTGPTGWSLPAGFSGAGPVTDGGVTWTKLGSASGTYPNPFAQLQVVTDGTFWYSPLQRNFGGQFLEDITDLNTTTAIGGSALAVYADGVLQTAGTNYTLLGPGLALPTGSFMGMYLKWAMTSPVGPPTGPITAQFNFFFRARFESDDLDFEEFLSQVWTIGGPDTKNGAGYLKLMTARPNPL